MTDQQHPITPPPELVEEWIAEVWHEGTPVQVSASDLHLASKAAEWGARYGHQPAPAAEGEVGELVEFLRIYGDEVMDEYGDVGEHDQLTRAAELLERQAAPVPIPVSERLPGAEDCDAEGRCWLHLPDMGTEPLWRLTDPSLRSRYHSHWLPASSLPLPAGEVEP